MVAKGKTSSKARLRASDITDVETGLENIRREQIVLGGLPLSERPAEQIFFLDQKGINDEAGQRELRNRGLLAKRPLRIDEILRPASQVPPQRRPGAGSKGGSEKHLLERKVRAIQRATAAATDKNVERSRGTVADIWAAEEASVAKKIKRTTQNTNALQTTRVAPLLPPSSASYRPTPDELNKLVKKVKSTKARRLKKRRKLRGQLPPLALLTGHAGASAMDLAVREILSGAQGRSNPDEDDGVVDNDTAGKNSNQEAAQNDDEENVRGPTQSTDPRRPLKKTKRERRKEARMKERLARQRQAERKKCIQRQLDSLKAIARQVRQEANIKAQKEKASNNSKSNIAISSRQASNTGTLLAFKSPEEIPSSMRTMKTGGNLVLERFRSLRQCGLLGRPVKGAKVAKGKGRMRRLVTKIIDRR